MHVLRSFRVFLGPGACCTKTVISLLLHPAAILLSPSVLVFAILETFILLTV